MDTTQMKPAEVHIQEEEVIWKDNYLPTVDLYQRKDILSPAEIYMQALKGKIQTFSLLCIAALMCSSSFKISTTCSSKIQRQ